MWLWVKTNGTILTTHFRTFFRGWIESDVHWGYDLGFDPWPCKSTGMTGPSFLLPGLPTLRIPLRPCESLRPLPSARRLRKLSFQEFLEVLGGVGRSSGMVWLELFSRFGGVVRCVWLEFFSRHGVYVGAMCVV